jgi:MoxR-like ATPase
MENNVNKVCALCPSYLTPEKGATKFGKNTGSPMCGRFGTILGKPGLGEKQEEKLQRHVASKCSSFGQPMPPEPVARQHLVALPDPDMRVRAEDPNQAAAVRTCLSCKKFIPAPYVKDAFGWTEGLCSARGTLLLGNRLTYEARDCEYKQLGQYQQSADKIQLLPEYSDAFGLNDDPIRSHFRNKGNIVEPHEYPTDKAVSSDEEAAGIRAWREIRDPEGTGNSVHLPIYSIDFFSAEEQAKIPRTGQDEHPELYIDHFGGVYLAAVAWTQLDETPAVWGQAGVGKTELFRHLAWLMCLPFERISITAETEVDELIGKMLYEPTRGTYFHHGRLPRAWSKPCVLVIDEPNVGPPEVWQCLRPLTDNSKQLVIDQNESERIPRHDDCYLGMAMNPAWDVKNVGALEISDADANRLFHVYVEPPPEILEREIISARVALDGWTIDEPRMDMLMAIAKDLRALIDEGTLPITWGVRPQIKVARAMRWFDIRTSYKRAIGDFLEPDVHEKLMDTVRSHAVSS